MIGKRLWQTVLLASVGPALLAAAAATGAATAAPQDAGERLRVIIDAALAIRLEGRDDSAYEAAAAAYDQVLENLSGVRIDELGLDDQVDYELLVSHVRTRIFEYRELQLHRLVPVRWFALGRTDRLFIRPGAAGDAGIRSAIAELQALPQVLETARRTLTKPARTWTENAIYQAHYAKVLLSQELPEELSPDAALRARLRAATTTALAAIEDFEAWLRVDLLPRSDREPVWTPEQIDFYQIVHEQLEQYPTNEMLRVARAQERETLTAMQELALRIHPDGDLRTVWENMKDEAPPWDGVVPMAQRFVDMAADWLQREGSHVVTLPSNIDYGARLTTPMGRRTLSFGGATIGPTVAGRRAGYYVLTPLEELLDEQQRASRIRSYNPYWTHVISYHEWLGHVIQLAIADREVTRPMRKAFSSIYFSQAWSFYLEKLLEDEGYYEDRLDYTTALKTRMARLQMRMWRIQRILTKVQMARGEMTFDEAVQAYVDKIGMEPTNAFIEVQRDSQSPSPPGREIIGELVILELRDEYRRRMGEHYTLRNFNDTLLTYGSLPFRQIRRLMFRE